MSCPICFNNFDDHVNERRCYTICASGVCGYAVCQACSIQIQRCPSCRGPLLANPVFTRVNNVVSVQPNVANLADPMELEARPLITNRPVVVLIDISGSMQTESGAQDGAPTRLELAVHMAKVTLAFCRKLQVKCHLYTFSETLTKISVDEKTPIAEANRVLEKIQPDGQTLLGLALRKLFTIHGETGRYFVFTDGAPTDQFEDSIPLFINSQLHLIAFSKDVSTELLRVVGNSKLHTTSYIEDVRSLSGYMVPVFIWAMTDMKTVVLNETDEECRKRFVAILEPQVRGSTAQYKLEDIISMLHGFNTPYSHDLEIDTIGMPGHGRIAYSFIEDNWHKFGKFYLPCILHCHKHLSPGNAFDTSLKHYRTPEYNAIFNEIADIPITIEFVSFMAQEAQRAASSAAASAVVQQTFQYMDSYSASSWGDDGCIAPDAEIAVYRNGHQISLQMKDVVPGDLLENSKIKWIIRVKDLWHGKAIALYNGLTSSHPVLDLNGKWIPAKDYPNAKVTYTTDVVYDVILDNPKIGSMRVNDIDVAVVGYPVPGMVHPYWGSSKVVEDVKARYPNGGFVDVDAKQFRYDANGLVSSLFGANK